MQFESTEILTPICGSQRRQPSGGGKVGPTGGFRDAVFRGAGQHYTDGGVDVYAMSDGNENWSRSVSASQCSADNLSLIFQLCVAPCDYVRLFVCARQPGLCATYGRHVEKEAQVAGDAKASRVGDALAVDKQDVRRGVKGLKHGDEDGSLPEGEQSRDIWECHFRVGNTALNGFQIRVAQDDHSSRDPTVRPNTRYIKTCNQLGVPYKRTDYYPVGKPALNVDGLGR